MNLESQIESILASLFAVINDERQTALARAAATCLLELLDVQAAQYEPETQAA